ncbi:MAG TPA: thioredoxin family protein [Flavobacterium sp.]|nr:thioredoxin family protein [Flavobacterium sp.]
MKLKTLMACLFLACFISAASAQEKASVLLENAMAQARKENKKVFVMYHASWCKWCKLMERNMNVPLVKPFFDRSYVFVFLTVDERGANKSLENPGAAEMLKKAKAESSGLPFWQIYDTDGKILEDAFNFKHQNLGCPSTQEEIAEFTYKLKNTSSLDEAERRNIALIFAEKKK